MSAHRELIARSVQMLEAMGYNKKDIQTRARGKKGELRPDAWVPDEIAVECGGLYTSIVEPERKIDELKKDFKKVIWLPYLTIFESKFRPWRLFGRFMKRVDAECKNEVYEQPTQREPMNGTKTKFKIEAYEVEYNKTVSAYGSGGGVYLPYRWVGRKVHIVLLEPPAEEKKDEQERNPKA